MRRRFSGCRVCGNVFFRGPLLHFINMPRSAQYLPELNSLKDDKGFDFQLVQCSGCGLVQLNSAPVFYFKEVIRAVSFSEEMRDFRLDYLKSIVEKYDLWDKRVIEVGCGDGTYLLLLSKFINDVWGIEYSAKNVKECKKKGLRVIRGFIKSSNFELNDGPFDAFFMFSFLEHLPEPNRTLRGIFNNLKEDGIGIIEVPNFNMILKNKLFSEFIPDHLSYFTKETLGTTLSLNGFQIMEINEIWHDYILSAIVKKRSKYDLLDFSTKMGKVIDNVRLFVDRFKNVVIWGAGHQALAILAMCDISVRKKIKYVIDSATFKQGKYTPVTHIPIVSPETANRDSIEAIIVIAGSYTDEVVRLIKEGFRTSIRVAALKESGLEIIR